MVVKGVGRRKAAPLSLGNRPCMVRQAKGLYLKPWMRVTTPLPAGAGLPKVPTEEDISLEQDVEGRYSEGSYLHTIYRQGEHLK